MRSSLERKFSFHFLFMYPGLQGKITGCPSLLLLHRSLKLRGSSKPNVKTTTSWWNRPQGCNRDKIRPVQPERDHVTRASWLSRTMAGACAEAKKHCETDRHQCSFGRGLELGDWRCCARDEYTCWVPLESRTSAHGECSYESRAETWSHSPARTSWECNTRGSGVWRGWWWWWRGNVCLNCIVQHLVSLSCTNLWELNVQIIPLHRSAWCHNDFVLRISVDLHDIILSHTKIVLWMKYALRINRVLAIFSQEEEMTFDSSKEWNSY